MAYGARLESVLGESPRGFESPILRQTKRPAPVGLFRFSDAARVTRSAHSRGSNPPFSADEKDPLTGGSFWYAARVLPDPGCGL